MHSWPHCAAWQKRIPRNGRCLTSCGVTITLRFSCLFSFSSLFIVPLHCFNQVHWLLIWRGGGGLCPYHFLEYASWKFNSARPARAAFQPSFPPIFYSLFSLCLFCFSCLVCFRQGFVLAAICTSPCHYHKHASEADISFIPLTNAFGKRAYCRSGIKHYFEAVSFHYSSGCIVFQEKRWQNTLRCLCQGFVPFWYLLKCVRKHWALKNTTQ